MKRQRHFKPRLANRYRNKSEERIAEHLDFLGVPYQYEPKDGKVRYKVERTSSYLPDFVLSSGIILEVKGYMPSSDRAKYIRIRKSNPKLDIRFVFDRASSKLSKTSKTTYAQWAEKNGFLWCEKVIPLEWLQEQHRKSNERATVKAASPKGPPSPRKGGKPKPSGGAVRLRNLSPVSQRP